MSEKDHGHHHSHSHGHSHSSRHRRGHHRYGKKGKNFFDKDINPRKRRKGMSRKRIVTYIIALTFFIVALTVLQIVSKQLIKTTVPLVFAGICAIGFIFGERSGALAGFFGGLLLDYIGTSGLSYSPPLFLICGYFCGKLVGWFLSYNFPSFMVYITISGVIKEIATFIYYSLFYDDHLLVLNRVIIPDYIACIIVAIPLYFAIKLIYKLFRKL